MQNKGDNKRILKNTLLLYVRMFITLSISLFTTRIIFQVLGINDLGIYNLVGGVISMLGILTSTMAGSSQRFISFELGKGELSSIKNVFSSIFLIHVVLALFILIIAEILGTWFVNTQLIIDESRMYAANWVYQMSVLTFVVGIVTVPFTALIMAHEKMGIYAYLSILDVVMKLIILYVLFYVDGDSLIWYSSLLALSSLITSFINIIYSNRKFDECNFKFYYNKSLFCKIFSFSGWNLLGQATIISNAQVVNIFLNLFFGTAVNGARGIAQKINSVVVQFVYQFQAALRPPIVKSFAANDINRSAVLIISGSKMCFLLMMILSMPVIICADEIMTIWLGSSPEYTSNFVRLLLIDTLIDTMTGPIEAGINATGCIKKVRIYTSMVLLVIIPVSYLFLKLGLSPYWVLLANISTTIVTLIIRIKIFSDMFSLRPLLIVRQTIITCFLTFVFALAIPLLVYYYIDYGLYGNASVTVICSLFSATVLSYTFALNQQERNFVNKVTIQFLKKFNKI